MVNLRGLVTVVGVFTISFVLAPASAVSAQTESESECSYSECSLRMKTGFFGRSLVRGVEEEKVIGLGLWVGDLDPVFEGNPEALELGARYRHRHNVGSLVAFAGLAVFAKGYTSAVREGDAFNRGWNTSVGLMVSGSLVTVIGAIITGSGEDALHKAIWEHNRTLVRSPSMGGDAR